MQEESSIKDPIKFQEVFTGVGVSCVNALSSDMKVSVHRDGKEYEQRIQQGIPLYSVREVGPSDKTGTITHFLPDTSIFTISEYNYDTLCTRLRELSFLNPKGLINHQQSDIKTTKMIFVFEISFRA